MSLLDESEIQDSGLLCLRLVILAMILNYMKRKKAKARKVSILYADLYLPEESRLV